MHKQLEFSFRDEPVPDPLAERLVATGLVPNHFVLELNRCLTNPYPEALPSRLFRFPIEFVAREQPTAASRLLLRHPALADHPFVAEVAAKAGVTPVWEALDAFGRDRGALPRWWHAVDLMTESHWRDLLATRHFTDNAAIAGAIAHRLDSRAAISVATAREVLDALGSAEPLDRSRALLMSDAIRPTHVVETNSFTREVQRERWPLNLHEPGADGAWLTVHGIEDGWFERDRQGYLQLSAEGRRLRPEWRVGALVRAGNDELAFHAAFTALAEAADIDAPGCTLIARAYTHSDLQYETREEALGAIEGAFYQRRTSALRHQSSRRLP